MDVPVSPGALAEPPGAERIAAAQRVLMQTQEDLARNLDQQILEQKAVLDHAESALNDHINIVIADGEVAKSAAQQQLDRRINLVLGNAMLAAGQHGVSVPPPSEIRTRPSFPPPEILHTAPGNSPQPPIDAANPYGGWAAGGQSPAQAIAPPTIQQGPAGQRVCQVHLLPDPLKALFRELCGAGNEAWVMEINSCRNSPQWIYTFPNWWTAELACRLIQECGQSVDWVRRYVHVIERVQLAGPGQMAQLQPLCKEAVRAIEMFGAQNPSVLVNPVPQSIQDPLSQRPTLPDGYCYWCDRQGNLHVYPCNAETVPGGWYKCNPQTVTTSVVRPK